MSRSTLKFANRLERFFAFMLDRLAVLMLQAMVVQALGGNDISFLIAFLCEAAFYTYFISGNWQATPGQRLLSIHVVKRDGARLTRGAALERFLAYILPFLPLYTSVFSEATGQALTAGLMIFWFMPILFTPEYAGVHDQLCNTRVVTGKAEDRGTQ